MAKQGKDFKADLMSRLLELQALQDRQNPGPTPRTYEEKKAVLLSFLDELLNAPEDSSEGELRRELQKLLE